MENSIVFLLCVDGTTNLSLFLSNVIVNHLVNDGLITVAVEIDIVDQKASDVLVLSAQYSGADTVDKPLPPPSRGLSTKK